VDSHLPSLGATRWRTATLVTGTIAALEAVLLLAAGAVLLARPLSHHGRTSAQAKPAAKAKPAPAAPVRRAKPVPPKLHLSRARTTVLVLNGNGQTGAAGAEAAAVRRFGYRINQVADAARMDYPASVVMYRPGYEAEGRRLARDLGITVVGPLDGVTVRELKGAQATVVVGH
jgi:hypothetical protein